MIVISLTVTPYLNKLPGTQQSNSHFSDINSYLNTLPGTQQSDLHFSDSHSYLDALLTQSFQAVHGLAIELWSKGVLDDLCHAVLHLLAGCGAEIISRRQSVQAPLVHFLFSY